MTDLQLFTEISSFPNEMKEVQEFNGLRLQGEHRLSLDAQNTFNLATLHTVVWSIGISIFLLSSVVTC